MAREKTNNELANSRLLTVLTLVGAIVALVLRTSASPLDIGEIEPSSRPQLSTDTMMTSINHPHSGLDQ